MSELKSQRIQTICQNIESQRNSCRQSGLVFPCILMTNELSFLLDDVYGKNADEVRDKNKQQKLLCPLFFVDVDIIERQGDFFLPSRHQVRVIVTFQTVSVAGPSK